MAAEISRPCAYPGPEVTAMTKRSKVAAGVVVAVLGLAVAIGLPTASWLSGQRDAQAAEPARAAETAERREAPAPKAEPTVYLDEIVVSAPKPRRATPVRKPARTCEPGTSTHELIQQGAPGARTVRVTTFCN